MQDVSDSVGYSGDFSLVATGDSLICEKLSTFKEKEFLRVCEIIREADAAFTNFETTIRNNKGFPRYKRDPTVWMTSPPFVLDELRWMGFSLFSLANNHAMDYGEEGMLENLRVFEEPHVTHAGAGRNLSEARAAAYLTTPKAKVALIATNTRDEDGPAGDAWGSLPGRPGINPLRYTTTKYLPRTDFDRLAEMSRKLGLPEPREGGLSLFGLREIRSIDRFEIGEKAEIRTAPYKPDFDGNIRSISEAKKNAEFVFVSIHNHEKLRPGEAYFDDTIEHVAEFVGTFSRAAIDAGANAVLGHGTHVINGIEIYKGCPIFYGLGNFISHSHQSIPQPYDWYEARGLHEEEIQDEETASRRPTFDRTTVLTGAAEERQRRRLATGLVAGVTFKERRTRQITLYPIRLLTQQLQGGRPLLASGSDADEILSRISRLSAQYGTKIAVDQGIGKIEL